MTVQELIDFLSTKDPKMEVFMQNNEDGEIFATDAKDWVQGYADDDYLFFLDSRRWKKERKEFGCEWSKESLLLKAYCGD